MSLVPGKRKFKKIIKTFINKEDKTVITQYSVTPIYNRTGHKRKPKTSSTSPKKKLLNKQAKIRRLTDIINANFMKSDFFIDLTFGDADFINFANKIKGKLGSKYPGTIDILKLINADRDDLPPAELAVYDAMYHHIQTEAKNYMNRLKRIYPDLRYVYTIGNSETKTTMCNPNRFHVHAVLHAAGLTVAEINKKWGYGLVKSENLRAGHKERLAAYMVNQVKAAPGTRIYTASHNMIHPIIVTETVNSMYTPEFYYPHLMKEPIETPVCGCIGWRAVDEKMLI